MGEIDEFSELEKELTENTEQIKLELQHNEDDFEYIEKGFKNRNFLHNSYKISIIIFGIGLIISLFFIEEYLSKILRSSSGLFIFFCFNFIKLSLIKLFIFHIC